MVRVACAASAAVILTGAPQADARAPAYRFVKPPLVAIVRDDHGSYFDVTARLDRAAPRGRADGVQLGVSPVGRRSVFGSGANAYGVGIDARHCYFAGGVGRADEGLPSSLRHPRAGQRVRVVLTVGARSVSTTVRLVEPPAAQAGREGYYSRQLGCRP